MPDDLLQGLFLRACDRLDATRRRTSGIVLVALVVHLAALTAYRDRAPSTSEVAPASAGLAAARRSLESLQPVLESTRRTALEQLQEELERLTGAVDSDLSRLEATARHLRARARAAAEAAGTDPPAALWEGEAAPPAEPFELDDPGELYAIEDAGDAGELIAALQPIAESRVVAPRLEELRRRWAHRAAPDLIAELDRAFAPLPGLRAGVPALSAPLTAFGGAVREVRRRLEEIELPAAPLPLAPSEPEGSDADRLLRLSPALRSAWREPTAVVEITAAFSRAESDRRGALAELGDAPADADEPSLSSAPSGAGVGPRLRAAAAALPLLLGATLAGALFLRSRRLRQLRLLADMLLADGSGEGLRWWQVEDGGARGVGAWRLYLPAVAGLLWIGLAAWHTALATGLAPSGLALPAAGGGALLAASVIYRILLPRSDRQAAKSEASDPDGRSSLDGLDLDL